jgi:hypothetical protein
MSSGAPSCVTGTAEDTKVIIASRGTEESKVRGGTDRTGGQPNPTTQAKPEGSWAEREETHAGARRGSSTGEHGARLELGTRSSTLTLIGPHRDAPRPWVVEGWPERTSRCRGRGRVVVFRRPPPAPPPRKPRRGRRAPRRPPPPPPPGPRLGFKLELESLILCLVTRPVSAPNLSRRHGRFEGERRRWRRR